MTARIRNTAVALTGAAALASGAYALGSQAGDGSASARDTARGSRGGTATFAHFRGRFGERGFRERGDFGLDALASKLGVSTSDLRAALDDVRDQLAPKTDPRQELASKLADALNLPVDKVTAAFDKLHPDHGARGDFAAALAKALDLDVAKVQAALDKVRSQFRPGPGANRADFESALADALGVSVDKLRSAFQSLRPPHRPGDHAGERPSLDALANALGVTTDQLRSAFEKIRSDLQAEFKVRRDAFVTALAKRLNLDKAKVEDALSSLPHPHGPGPGGGPPGGPFFGGP